MTGATFLLTLWYKRYEVQSRMAVFYTAASLSGAFSGLLAFGIEKMDGIAGQYILPAGLYLYDN